MFLSLTIGFLVGFFSNANSPSLERKNPDWQAARFVAVKMKVTAYDADRRCTDGWSKQKRTSTGKDAKILDGVAADPKLLPYGTKLVVPGFGEKIVDDTGGAMRQSAKNGVYHIDIRLGSHKEAERFGIRWMTVYRVTGEN